MGRLECYQKHINRHLSEEGAKNRLEQVKREIFSEWKRYKINEWNLHGVRVKDNWPDMVLSYLIKRGVL